MCHSRGFCSCYHTTWDVSGDKNLSGDNNTGLGHDPNDGLKENDYHENFANKNIEEEYQEKNFFFWRDLDLDLSIFNLGTVMSGAVFQPLVGILLDASWKGEKDGDGARLYSNQDYMNALSVFPAAMGTCVILLAFCFPTDVSLEDASPAEIEMTCLRDATQDNLSGNAELRQRSAMVRHE